DNDRAFLVFANYEVIMDWNKSIYFATTVNLLADAIKKDLGKKNSGKK
ncbi:MAG: lytic murein transglycosylase, partial [Pseudomonadota bacterium]